MKQEILFVLLNEFADWKELILLPICNVEWNREVRVNIW